MLRTLALTALTALTPLAAAAQAPAPAAPPNILVIFGDDIGVTSISAK